jgi:hypothetical protein
MEVKKEMTMATRGGRRIFVVTPDTGKKTVNMSKKDDMRKSIT